MQVKLHKLLAASTTGIKLAALSLLMFVNVFYTRAQVSDASVRVHFAFDNATLSESYMANSSAMTVLDSMVAKISDNSSVSIVTFSSPEGNFAYNLDLSRKRAESVRQYIVSKYPSLEGRIVVNAGAESWEELRRSMQNDVRLSSYARTRALEIIDSEDDADHKEVLLKQIPAYKSLYANYFKGLRYAEISLRIKNLTQDTPQHTNVEVSESKMSAPKTNANGEAVVYYSLSEDFIRLGHMNNGLNLKEIRRILSNPENRKQTIVIEGAASPEGPVSVNTRLGISRAENLANWIIGQFPDMEGKVEVRSKGEDWEGLANAIASCTTISSDAKSELLDIIGSNESADKKEADLKAHAAYETILTDVFPYIRFARISGLAIAPVQEPAVEPAQEPVAEPVQEPVQEPAQEPAHEHETEAVTGVEGDGNVQGQEGNIAGSGVNYKFIGKNMIVAAKTNLLYDAVTALNFEVEVPIADRFSIMAEDVFPWWETGNKYCFQLWEMGVEARYWFKPWKTVGMEKLRGWFAGPYVMSAKYDFQFDKSINYQGEFWSAGVTAGFAMPIGKKQKANLEFSLSYGYMESPFRHYQPTDDYVKLIKDPANNGTFYNIFKYPTKAKVSLVVPIGIPTHKKEVTHE